MVSRTEHSANPDKFAHVLQQSRWRSSESLVVRHKYFIRVEDAGCGRGSRDRALWKVALSLILCLCRHIVTTAHYIIIIIKSEVWTITHCLGLGHETMVSAVCLSIFLCSHMIKISLRHQVFINRIKRILCWDSFICLIAMLHAHQDEISRGIWLQ